MPSAKSSYRALLHFFDERLWGDAPFGGRSAELTPLYVDRYRGIRYGVSLWTHDHWELTCTLAGEGTLVGREDIPLIPNTVCLIPPRVAHDERGGEGLDTIWIGFRGQRVESMSRKSARAVRSKALAEFIEEIWIFAKEQAGPIGPELDSMTATALAWFLRLLHEGGTSADTVLVQRALRFIDRHFAEVTYISDLAERLGCSAGHLHRLFKQHTGRPPTVYLTNLRIQHAVRLLEQSNLPVAEICRLVGFDDQFYFSRVFHRSTGLTPTAHRRRARPP